MGPPSGLDTAHRAVERGQPPHHPAHAGARVGVRPARAVVTDDRRAAPRPRARAPPRRCRAPACFPSWPGTRRPRSRPRTRPAPAGARPGGAVTRTGTAMSSASACTAPARPRSASTGGWMPRTTARRSASAAPVVSRASLTSLRAASGSSANSCSAMPEAHRRARPAGPARRRAGRARCGAARRPSGRRLSARDTVRSATRCSRVSVCPGLRKNRSIAALARMMCGAPNHQMTGGDDEDQQQHQQREQDSLRSSRPGSRPASRQVIGSRAQVWRRRISGRPSVGRRPAGTACPRVVAAIAPVGVGQPPQRRDTDQQDRDADGDDGQHRRRARRTRTPRSSARRAPAEPARSP